MKGKIIAIVVLLIIAAVIAWYLLKGSASTDIGTVTGTGNDSSTGTGTPRVAATPVQILRGDEVSGGTDPRAGLGSSGNTGVNR